MVVVDLVCFKLVICSLGEFEFPIVFAAPYVRIDYSIWLMRCGGRWLGSSKFRDGNERYFAVYITSMKLA